MCWTSAMPVLLSFKVTLRNLCFQQGDSSPSPTTLKYQCNLLQKPVVYQGAPAVQVTLLQLAQLCLCRWRHTGCSRKKQGQKERTMKWTTTLQKSQPCGYWIKKIRYKNFALDQNNCIITRGYCLYGDRKNSCKRQCHQMVCHWILPSQHCIAWQFPNCHCFLPHFTNRFIWFYCVSVTPHRNHGAGVFIMRSCEAPV